MIAAIAIVIGVLLVLAATVAGMAVRVLREYERAVVFRLGRLMDQRGPGLLLLIPSIDRMVRISLRTVTLTVPPQEIITRDNVPARVTAVAYYRVVDPSRAVTEVENFDRATQQIAQTSLRSILGVVDLDTLLSEREHLNESLQQVIDNQTEPWGIKVTTVEIKDVEIPERMQHAIARQAEAERERRAKIINAEGEFQASARLRDAAEVIGENPIALQLRYLQTLREIGGSQNSTIVFPMPVDVVGSMVQALGRGGSEAAGAEPSPAAVEPDQAHRLDAGDELGGVAPPEASRLDAASGRRAVDSAEQLAQIDAAAQRALSEGNAMAGGSAGEHEPGPTRRSE